MKNLFFMYRLQVEMTRAKLPSLWYQYTGVENKSLEKTAENAKNISHHLSKYFDEPIRLPGINTSIQVTVPGS